MIDFGLPFAKRSLESGDRRADIAGFAWRLGLCVLMALGLRAATFGNPNLFVDEALHTKTAEKPEPLRRFCQSGTAG